MSLDHFETGDRTIHPVVVLKNGLRVANFSSPHPFTFDDGTILPACPDSTVESGELKVKEKEYTTESNGIRYTVVDIEFELSKSCATMLFFVCERPEVDIVLVPLPVLQCIKSLPDSEFDVIKRRLIAKCRVVRMKDRIKKVIYSDKFCI